MHDLARTADQDRRRRRHAVRLPRARQSTAGVPVVFLHHFTAVLDDWDPRVLDGVAAQHHVIAFDNRGVGATGGKVPHTTSSRWAADAIAFIRALGYDQVDLFGFSLGGASRRWSRCRPPTSSGGWCSPAPEPEGGGGIWKMPFIVGGAYAKAFADPQGPAPLPVLPPHHRGEEGRGTSTSHGSRSGPPTATDRSRGRPGSRSCGRSPPPALHAPDDLSAIKGPSWSPTATTT